MRGLEGLEGLEGIKGLEGLEELEGLEGIRGSATDNFKSRDASASKKAALCIPASDFITIFIIYSNIDIFAG